MLEAMLACETHRGPDDQGIDLFQVGGLTLALGQRRLSIIDLSAAGHQPMLNAATGDAITYNGELYNYLDLRAPFEQRGTRFRGHSDTEVLLYGIGEQGPRFLEKTRGMYAVAYYDAAKRRLMFARDPMGIKPLYIAERDGYIVWASEVRAVLASGLVDGGIDARGLAGLMAYGCVPEPLTFFSGIRAFPAGAWQWIDLDPASGGYRAGPIARHWDFPDVDESITEADAVERLRSTLDNAVRQHLIADVPVGVFLSSGLDSTIVASLARRHTERLRTFTVGFSDHADLNESLLAQETARNLGVEHHDLQVTNSQAQGWAEEWFKSLDQPSVDGLNTYVISKAVRQQGIVVALSGLGGDELFCGYTTFEELLRIKRGYDLVSWLPGSLRKRVFAARAANFPASVRERISEMAASDGDLLTLYLYRRRAMSDLRLMELGLDAAKLGLTPSYMPEEALDRAAGDPTDVVAAVSRLESRFYMRNMLLRDSDTNGMAHSLEIRVPMIDTRMLDLAYSIPGHVRMPTGRYGKHLLKAAFTEEIPEKLRSLPKRGFVLPTRRWISGPMRERCEAALESVKAVGFLNGKHIDAVWQEFLANPDTQVWGQTFLLCVLGVYLDNASRAGAPKGLGRDDASTLRLSTPQTATASGAA